MIIRLEKGTDVQRAILNALSRQYRWTVDEIVPSAVRKFDTYTVPCQAVLWVRPNAANDGVIVTGEYHSAGENALALLREEFACYNLGWVDRWVDGLVERVQFLVDRAYNRKWFFLQ